MPQSEHFANFLRDRFGGCQPARTRHSAGQIAFVGIDHVHAASCATLARFSCVAGCSHIFTFIAGATITGAFVARYNVPRKSSAMPCANFPMTSAVAGATSRRSIRCATAMCSMALSTFAGAASRCGKQVRDYFLSGECRKGERSDEFLSPARHHYLHVQLFLLQAAHQFRCLVSRNSPCNAQCDSHTVACGCLLPLLFFLVDFARLRVQVRRVVL